ncbi:MAG: pre-peptidase C-terminal domain-containing protein [Jaaginema sp. PMC 1079.18]|nr:pre-peptidase C-terminal domain-containing protein [Jaaginema sp. PMC 1080.18]MEC4853124.1 pre-peptidase C-terminal domain-containing protein [Jaaginema sp. PMC 1079.18]MEC4868541.1 pre-peptidase C-terminal domain-containing protein [Jaaginema sp. PMC 1078.18]
MLKLSLSGFISLSLTVLISPVQAVPHPLTSPTALVALSQEGVLNSGDNRLSDDSLYDKYTFDGRAGQVVIIDLQSSEFDTYLILSDPQGNKIGENDDVEDNNTNSRLIVSLPQTGVYELIVNGYDTSSQGRYRFDLNRFNRTQSGDTEDFVAIQEVVYQWLSYTGLPTQYFDGFDFVYSVSDYAIASYSFREGGGQALLRERHGAWQFIMGSGGSIQDANYLTNFGVPRNIAEELEAGPDI